MSDRNISSKERGIRNCGYDPTCSGWVVRDGTEHVATFRREVDANEYVQLLLAYIRAPETGAPQAEIKRLNELVADHEEVQRDHMRLVRELDVLLNGEAGAAPQASLCDIVSQLRARKSRPRCEGCGHEIDPDICGCGDPITHSPWAGHAPIPMGCVCRYSQKKTGSKPSAPSDASQPPVPASSTGQSGGADPFSDLPRENA